MQKHGQPPPAQITTVPPHACIQAKQTTIVCVIDCTQRATHRIIYTPSIRHGRYCRQMEHTINTERRSWLRKRRKARPVCQCVLNRAHMCRAADARALSEAFLV